MYDIFGRTNIIVEHVINWQLTSNGCYHLVSKVIWYVSMSWVGQRNYLLQKSANGSRAKGMLEGFERASTRHRFREAPKRINFWKNFKHVLTLPPPFFFPENNVADFWCFTVKYSTNNIESIWRKICIINYWRAPPRNFSAKKTFW